ncbi:MAG: 30S ribosomal protein S21 [Nitrospirae bacterium]|nr:30S ribosomal protein S21 [Nitrospirota bacterium]
MEIRVNDNDIEKALKILKRKLEKDGLMGELKKRRFYEKPSDKLKSKQREAKKRKAKNRSRKMKDSKIVSK